MRSVLITGGAGFIGSNLAARLLSQGWRVKILDDLSRPGSERNLAWLKQSDATGGLEFRRADINEKDVLAAMVGGTSRVYHLAGQVAVTRSVENPHSDFLANAYGTLNLLEAVRTNAPEAVFIYASTNKVYGAMPAACVEMNGGRYSLLEFPLGIPESFPLDFHSPYGCSKGAGDQYTRDYQRIFGVRTIVFRQSCIYGPRQFGLSDQGWLAWFVFAALKGLRIQICGDGRQVRDVLYVEDLLDAYELAAQRADDCAGEVFNIGGGSENALSVWTDVEPLLAKLTGRRPEVTFAPWRPGDQKAFVSDTRKAKQRLGWSPRIPIEEGLTQLARWIREQHEAGA